MFPFRVEVLSGNAAGRVLASDAAQVRIGRAPDNDLELPDTHVSAEHARLTTTAQGLGLEDLRSTNGTAVVRGELRLPLLPGAPLELCSGDVIELGGAGADATTLRITFESEAELPHVLAVRSLPELSEHQATVEGDAGVVKTLYEVQKTLGRADDLQLVLAAVADAALALVPRATHVTLVLRGDTESADDEATFVPVLSKGRSSTPGAPAPIPIARSVYRKVIRERAAVLAADAPRETFSSESLLGASIRSTIAVPLWKGEEIVGVLQVDNRDAPAMFHAGDVDLLGVLAANASLAVANARLIRRLTLAEEQLRRENSFLKGRERARSSDLEIIGESKAMAALMAQLAKVVDTRVTVLIEGETGVGKELIASAVHYRSKRRDKLFVTQNCAALPESLLESELFGHKRGAFTGATEEKKGLFEVADGGTLFLDEVTEMPLALQAKLLRALQQGEIRALGGTTTKVVDVRIVAACNRNLDKEVEAGRFREDLYYRLKVFPLSVPPLRERREDVPLLARYFLQRYTKELGKPVAGFAQDALDSMTAYDWPGNVRELQNEIQRMMILADPDGFIDADLLSPKLRKTEEMLDRADVPRGTLKDMLEHLEKHLLIEALREHGNNKTSAAKALGITREGLHKKLRALKIG